MVPGTRVKYRESERREREYGYCTERLLLNMSIKDCMVNHLYSYCEHRAKRGPVEAAQYIYTVSVLY